jgi:hypothetical protein
MKKKGIRNSMFGNDDPYVVFSEEDIDADLEELATITSN